MGAFLGGVGWVAPAGMLVETTGIVRRAIESGKTLEQVKSAGLPDAWSEWGAGFINTSRWLEITYNSLKSEG